MSKESDKIAEALENMSITFDELGFSPTIPIPKGDKVHFIDWFKFEIDEIKAVSTQYNQRIAELQNQLEETEEERDGNYENYSICWKDNEYLKQQLAESESKRKSLEEKVKFLTEETEENFVDGQKYNELKQQLAESEEKVKHWHDLYNERDKQFQSVRQRYHLLNKLQSNYDKKDKLHLAYMQCLELVEENEKLKQYLAEKEKIEYTDTINFVETSEPDIVAKELDRLNEQLAEKDKEIKQLKKFDDLNKTFFELFRTAFKEPDKVDDLFNTLKTIQEKHNQDKISFAVEQLEKVKRTFIDVAWKDVDFAIEIIDNQIKSLKGDK